MFLGDIGGFTNLVGDTIQWETKDGVANAGRWNLLTKEGTERIGRLIDGLERKIGIN